MRQQPWQSRAVGRRPLMLYFILRVPTYFRWVFFQLLRMVTLRREQGRELIRSAMVGESRLRRNWQWEKILAQLPAKTDTFTDLCRGGCYKEYDAVRSGDYDDKVWYGSVLLSQYCWSWISSSEEWLQIGLWGRHPSLRPWYCRLSLPSLSPSCQIPSRNNSRFASFRCSS